MNLLFANDVKGEHAPSLYADTCHTTSFPELSNHIETDVCVIGAGYTGLSTALHCAEQGQSVAILDAHRVGWGASGRNGGQLGSGFNISQAELEKRLSSAHAHALWTLAENAKKTIHQLCADYSIDIEYQAGIIAAYHRTRYVDHAHKYCQTLSKQYKYEQLEPLSKEQLQQYLNSPAYYGGVLDHGAGHIHPLKLAYGLADIATAKGATIFERSHVRSIDTHSDGGKLIHTDSGSVRAKQVVLACNGYSDNINSTVQKRVMPINNYIVATQPLGEQARELLPERHAVFDSRFVVNYFRITKDNRLLFGGGETYGYKAWGGTLAITRSRLPYIAKLDDSTFSASGYSGHGVALAIESGKAIAAAIGGDARSFEILKELPCSNFPGGQAMRSALLVGAMSWYSMLDRI